MGRSVVIYKKNFCIFKIMIDGEAPKKSVKKLFVTIFLIKVIQYMNTITFPFDYLTMQSFQYYVFDYSPIFRFDFTVTVSLSLA